MELHGYRKRKSDMNEDELRELYEDIGNAQDLPTHPNYDSITHEELIMRNIPSDGKICLDLGCGSGYYLKVLGNRFDEAVGVDIARSKVEKAKMMSLILSCFQRLLSICLILQKESQK
jgi:ubiquinone/menaquinone biosynthesis C-methylase UbiE